MCALLLMNKSFFLTPYGLLPKIGFLLNKESKMLGSARDAQMVVPQITLDTLSEIIRNLYKAKVKKNVSVGSYLYSFFSSVGLVDAEEEPAPTPEQQQANRAALDEIKRILSLSSDANAEQIGNSLLESHRLIASSCINKDLKGLNAGLQLMQNLPLPLRGGLLEIRVAEENNASIRNLGLLGYVSYKLYLQLATALLKAGANPNATHPSDGEPCFFSVVDHQYAFSEYVTIKCYIGLNLECGFDINLKYKDKNILQYVLGNRSQPDLVTYHANFIVQEILKFVPKKISSEKLRIFCESLKWSRQLKFFPDLVDRCNDPAFTQSVYVNEAEKKYYQLCDLLLKIMFFCRYQQARMSDLLSCVSSAEKSNLLQGTSSDIQNIYNDLPGSAYIDLPGINSASSKLLSNMVALENIFKINRAPLKLQDASLTTSTIEWNEFCKENHVAISGLKDITPLTLPRKMP